MLGKKIGDEKTETELNWNGNQTIGCSDEEGMPDVRVLERSNVVVGADEPNAAQTPIARTDIEAIEKWKNFEKQEKYDNRGEHRVTEAELADPFPSRSRG